MPIIDRKTRLKVRRVVRRQKRQVEGVVTDTDAELDRLVVRRFSRLFAVRRFVAIWMALVLLLGLGALWQVRSLDKFFLTTAPVVGGVYREGIIGTFTNSNPLFATSSVDASVSRLLYSGLFKVNPNGEIKGDLASGVVIDDTAKKYTVSLRSDVQWHDGEPFTADDVVFTYKTIQNPDTRSPQQASWRGVKVTKIDDYTVEFELPNSFSSFAYALINGIVPQHILGGVNSTDLRSSSFNTVQPVGTGPFILKTLEVVSSDANDRQERIALSKNDNYYGQEVGLDGVVLSSYATEESMLKDFEDQSIKAMIGLSSVPDYLLNKQDVKQVSAPLTSSVMLFLNNNAGALSDVKVRRALVQGTNDQEIRNSIGYRSVPVDSPFLRSQFAYNPEHAQLPYDLEAAKKLLDEAGWKQSETGTRVKEEKSLKLRLISQSLAEYSTISQHVQKDWAELGIQVDAVLQPEEDIQGGAIARHDYDVLLYGISIGYDPDVFAYWHSSQADVNAATRLNLSEYSSKVADEALESGRTRTDEDLRKIKYEPFLKAWRKDAPAKALYQPRFLMVVRGTFEGFEPGQLSTATDRFYSISEWKVRNDQVLKQDLVTAEN